MRVSKTYSLSNDELLKRGNLIIEEFKKVYADSKLSRFNRDDFISKSSLPIKRSDIEEIFGSWTSFIEKVGLRPGKYQSVTDEELFSEYKKVVDDIKTYPLGAKGEKLLTEKSKYAGGTFKKRFGGLKNFLFEFKLWEKQKATNKVSQSITGKSRIISPNTTFKVPEDVLLPNRIFNGIAGEYLVLSELLFRSFNASRMPVDQGLDIFAVKDDKLYLIQVKHTEYLNKNKSGVIKITLSSIQKHQKSNVYYIFVLSRKELGKRDFLILPYSRLDELMKSKIISVENEAKQLSFHVLHETDEDDAYINKISEKNDV